MMCYQSHLIATDSEADLGKNFSSHFKLCSATTSSFFLIHFPPHPSSFALIAVSNEVPPYQHPHPANLNVCRTGECQPVTGDQ